MIIPVRPAEKAAAAERLRPVAAPAAEKPRAAARAHKPPRMLRPMPLRTSSFCTPACSLIRFLTRCPVQTVRRRPSRQFPPPLQTAYRPRSPPLRSQASAVRGSSTATVTRYVCERCGTVWDYENNKQDQRKGWSVIGRI